MDAAWSQRGGFYREPGPIVLYLRIDESGDGFGWEVRVFNNETPIETGTTRFPTDKTARASGRAALIKIGASRSKTSR